MSDDEDGFLWEHITKDVKPLSNREESVPEKKKERKITKAVRTVREKIIKPPEKEISKDRYNPGLDRRTEQKFRRGKMHIEGKIDLHGMTRAEAQPALEQFIFSSWERGKRCVLVVTGKGYRSAGDTGVLKQSLPVWLGAPTLRDIILRYTEAQPKDGGAGAYYVLLRRKR